jgi:hypothetical protein
MWSVRMVNRQGVLNQCGLHWVGPIDQGLAIEYQVVQDEQIARADSIVQSGIPEEPKPPSVNASMAVRRAASWNQPEIVDGLAESPQ